MIDCIICNNKLRVTLTGGEFLIREGSTPDNINFEKVQKINFETAEVLNADVMLELNIECSADASHRVFAGIDSKIRQEIYTRIIKAATTLRNKYHNVI